MEAEQSANAEKAQQIEVVLRSILEPDAKERLSNIRVINPEVYYKVAQAIFQWYQSGQLRGRVDDNTLKQILSKVQPKREFNITRK